MLGMVQMIAPSDRAHVLVLGVAQVGVLLDERVKVVGRVESNTCNY